MLKIRFCCQKVACKVKKWLVLTHKLSEVRRISISKINFFNGVCYKTSVTYDFEKSLSFLYPILGQVPKPWELSKLKLSGDDRHLFKSNLKAREKEINWQPLVEKVKQINKEKLEEICSHIPFEFGNYTDKICEHFASIVSNIKSLELELQRSLL